MILRLFNTTFEVKRQQWTTENIDGEDIDSSEETVVSEFQGYRQQASPEYVQSLAMEITKPHLIWCEVDTNVSEGDIISSEEYGDEKVRAIQINRDGNNPHKEILVEFIGKEEGMS